MHAARLFLHNRWRTASVAVLPETKLVDGHLICNISSSTSRKNSKRIVPCVGTKPTRRLFSSPKDASETAAGNVVLGPRRHGRSFESGSGLRAWRGRTGGKGLTPKGRITVLQTVVVAVDPTCHPLRETRLLGREWIQKLFDGRPDQKQEGFEDRAWRACEYCSTSIDRNTAFGATLRGGRLVQSLF